MDKIFTIGLFGLAPNERNTLGSIFKLAASRGTRYDIVADPKTAQIVLVDIDDPAAIGEWKSYSVHHAKTPLVRVTRREATSTAEATYLRRPLTLKRVIDTLQEVTISKFGHIEQSVGGEDIPDEAVAQIVKKRQQEMAEKGPSGVKVLVVDDSLPVRKSMEIHLGIYSMEIDFAETGEQALELTENNVYNLIFLDLMLPGIDGYKVCKTIKTDKRSKNTPVVMLTGKGGRIDKLRGTMAGASVYLTKPVEPDELKEVVQKFLPDVMKN